MRVAQKVFEGASFAKTLGYAISSLGQRFFSMVSNIFSAKDLEKNCADMIRHAYSLMAGVKKKVAMFTSVLATIGKKAKHIDFCSSHDIKALHIQ